MAREFGMDVEFYGSEQLQKLLDSYGEKADNFTPLFDKFKKFLQKAVAEQFSSEGKRFAFDGAQAWRPLHMKTIEQRRLKLGYYKRHSIHGPAHLILHWTERLKSSLMTNTNESIAEVKPLSFAFGSKVPYAIIHQKGARKGKRRIPARTLLHIGKKDTDKLMSMLKTYIEQAPAGTITV